ncbi:MAG TPA: YggS family pyridoxal phosphate-dependent enzyme [Flavipsychrobacter sp.]|nr:YggS family pyridoxal phosphate-dependent enzyme [Flavipsychrobacter sp.]
MINETIWKELKDELDAANATLVAVSKTKPIEDIQALYNLGQRDFGENYVQELVEKQATLPGDIQWHFIGHLQSNKVKLIAPFIHLIHAIDSFRLLLEVNKQAEKNNRVIDVLLQMHVANEETKFGMDTTDIFEFMEYYQAQKDQLKNVRIRGLMGMATFTDNETQIREEFRKLRTRFNAMKQTDFLFKDYFDTLSMGMSSDYRLAIAEGSTMVRIGSMLFGARQYS